MNDADSLGPGDACPQLGSDGGHGVSADTGLSRELVVLLACGAGLGAASLYYVQPILGELAVELAVTARGVGWLPTVTQLGYASGMFFLAPLGDRYDRRQIILAKAGLLSVALFAAAFAANLPQLLVACGVIGVAATLAQDIVPAAAVLAPAARRGRVVGSVMTGLLLGILLSRVVSGAVAHWVGWRVVFVGAALAVLLLAAALARGLPRFRVASHDRYGTLLFSLWVLWRRHAVLRQVVVAQSFISMGFSAFWSTLAVYLHGAPFHFSSAAAGAFGLAGAAGALAAPVGGQMADRSGAGGVSRLGAVVTSLSFLGMAALVVFPRGVQLVGLVIGAVTFDFGAHLAVVSHQSVVYGLDPAARSRLNALLLVGMFLGMAVGAAAGSWLLAAAGWWAVCLFAAAGAFVALLLRWRG